MSSLQPGQLGQAQENQDDGWDAAMDVLELSSILGISLRDALRLLRQHRGAKRLICGQPTCPPKPPVPGHADEAVTAQ